MSYADKASRRNRRTVALLPQQGSSLTYMTEFPHPMEET